MHRSLSSTGVLAVSAMIDLALQSRAGPVRLSVIGQRQRISKSYIDQLFGKLRRHALVQAARGPGGGYSLGRDAAQISVADIVIAVDKPRVATVRGRKARSRRDSAGLCLTHELWDDLNTRLIEWLEEISLQALIDERLAREASIEAEAVVRAVSARSAAKHVEAAANTPNSVFALGNLPSPQTQWAR
jgi:Rrf2 family iron-sulfur cluster assembly transcriptional regulator